MKVMGQYYERVYGSVNSTTPVAFHVLPDGGLIIAGNSRDSNNISGYYLLRTDAQGNLIWQNTYTDAFNAYSRSVTSIINDSIYLIGSHEGVVYQNSAEVVVFDSNGNITNSAMYPPLSGWGTSGVGICDLNDTSVSIMLYSDGVVSNNYYSLYSLNADLSVRWSDYVGIDDSYTTLHGCSPLSDGLYTISYYDNFFYSTPPLFNVTNVRRHDIAGHLTFDSLYEFGCMTTIINSTADGGALITGQVDNSGQSDPICFRIDSSGNVLWQKQYGSSLNELPSSVALTNDGGFLILSTVDDSMLPGQHDILLMKLDQNGDSIWSRYFGGTLDERALHIETAGSDIIFLGNTTSAGADHVYVVRTDSSGGIQSPFSVLNGNRYFCSGDTAVLYLSPSPRPDMHIQWSNGDTVNPLRTCITGSYYAVITDTSGSVSQTPFASVYFANPPVATFGADTISLCEGVVLEDTASNDITDVYQWYQDGNILFGENTGILQPAQSGIYSLTVTNYCSSDSSSSLVDTIFQLPSQPVLISDHTGLVCLGDSVRLSFAYDSTNIYQWFLFDTAIPLAADSLYYATGGGEYSVQATNANGCTVTSYPASVMYDDFPEFIDANGPTAFCAGGEITLSVSAGSDFHWSHGDSIQFSSVNTSGDYFVSFTDVYGCQKTSDTITITVLPRPVVSLGNDTLICSGSDYVLDAGAGFSNYLWNNGTAGQTLELNPVAPFPDSNNTTVYVVDSNGCPGVDSVLVIFDICAGVHELPRLHSSVFPTLLHPGEYINITCEGEMKFFLYDIAGRSVMETGKKKIISSLLKPGVYTYRLMSGIKTETGKLIIE